METEEKSMASEKALAEYMDYYNELMVRVIAGSLHMSEATTLMAEKRKTLDERIGV